MHHERAVHARSSGRRRHPMRPLDLPLAASYCAAHLRQGMQGEQRVDQGHAHALSIAQPHVPQPPGAAHALGPRLPSLAAQQRRGARPRRVAFGETARHGGGALIMPNLNTLECFSIQLCRENMAGAAFSTAAFDCCHTAH
eukprot:6186393-Pleurochrysis_carterae.AAC.1